jgi:hypothetical protein
VAIVLVGGGRVTAPGATRWAGGRARGRARVALLGLAAIAVLAGAGARTAGAAAVPPGVRGVVRTMQRPLEGAHVVIPEAGRFTVTDSLGRYDLGVIAPGLYSLTIVAVGYESAAGTVTVLPDSSAAAADWLLKPLRPDGGGLGKVQAAPPPPLPEPLLMPPPGTRSADSLLADSLLKMPGPGPIAPVIGLFLTPEERAARAFLPGALGELLPQIDTADSITSASGGMGEPGYESWRQWSERIAPFAADSLAESGIVARRALAYTRTRAALAEGPTWAGWQASKLARAALVPARRDIARGRPGESFLGDLEERLDATFVAGQEPAKPPPAKPKQGKKKRSHQR